MKLIQLEENNFPLIDFPVKINNSIKCNSHHLTLTIF